MTLYIIEIKKKNKWTPLIETGGRLMVYQITTIFYSEKDAEKYAAQYFGWARREETDQYSEFRISPIEPLEGMR